MLFSNLPLLIEKRTTKAKKNRKDVVLLNNFTVSVLFCSSFLKKNRALFLSKFYEKRTEPVLFVEIGPYKKRFFQRTAKKNRHCSQKSLFSDVIRNGVTTTFKIDWKVKILGSVSARNKRVTILYIGIAL